jgi:hypothetical protein
MNILKKPLEAFNTIVKAGLLFTAMGSAATAENTQIEKNTFMATADTHAYAVENEYVSPLIVAESINRMNGHPSGFYYLLTKPNSEEWALFQSVGTAGIRSRLVGEGDHSQTHYTLDTLLVGMADQSPAHLCSNMAEDTSLLFAGMEDKNSTIIVVARQFNNAHAIKENPSEGFIYQRMADGDCTILGKLQNVNMSSPYSAEAIQSTDNSAYALTIH